MRIRLFLTTAAAIAAMAVLSSQSDLDSLMSQVLERRDDNWKKLQQYTLEEETTFRLLGPMDKPIFGPEREYTGARARGSSSAVRVSADGVEVGEAERKRQEDDVAAAARSARGCSRGEAQGAPTRRARPEQTDRDARRHSTDDRAGVRAAAYFLDFKFESGHYALVGRERLLDRDVLRIEYYPEQLFRDDDA